MNRLCYLFIWFYYTLECQCDYLGSISQSCDETGKCDCKPNFEGEKCNTCMPEFYLVAGFDGEECARKCNLTI